MHQLKLSIRISSTPARTYFLKDKSVLASKKEFTDGYIGMQVVQNTYLPALQDLYFPLLRKTYFWVTRQQAREKVG